MSPEAVAPARYRVRVSGIVQGVGYRPFVFGLARRLGVCGFVGNDSQGVFIEAEAPGRALDAFLAALRDEAPPLAVVDAVACEPMAATGATGFEIVASHAVARSAALVTPDTATCARCLAEIRHSGERRYRYPFTNCTDCGPRFTITRRVPYDRPNTTMSAFAMCPKCAQEYADPSDRRFHAQPVCCPACGPRVSLQVADGAEETAASSDPIRSAAEMLREGDIVAVKGLGGYHLAVDASNESAVARLRARKHREDKPFAVMVADLDQARRLCHVDAVAMRMLAARSRPIVLLPRRFDGDVAPSVAPITGELGLLLPYTPLHHLLVGEVGRPIVLTSGNISDEPIAYLDDDARTRLAGVADAFLAHDRPIHIRTDDSVARVVRGSPVLLRRSRGYVPAPLPLPVAAKRPILACGAELKNTFCLVRGHRAFLSHHIGDLENAETLRSFVDGIAHLRGLFDVRPEVVAHDLHPEYLSTKYAYEQDGVELVGVQHHHAHIAACLADNGHRGPVIGIACDGTGYGPDGVLWGGEVMLADLSGYTRLAHLAELPLPGGVTAIRQPWRMAAAYLDALGVDVSDLEVVRRHEDRWQAVVALARSGHPVRTTSAGRLFDAVAAILGVRDTVNYEGQAAIELEQRVDPAESGAYPLPMAAGVLQPTELVAAVVADLRDGVDLSVIAARFHNGVADGLADAARRACLDTGVDIVALSGGVFQNVVLLTRVAARLEAVGFGVLTHSRVPPNDGGISFGQAAVAAAVG